MQTSGMKDAATVPPRREPRHLDRRSIATLLIIALCVLVGIVLTRLIAPRIARGTEMLERLAAKDLTAYVQVTGTDEIGRLGAAINKCAETIRIVLQEVGSGADTLSAASTEITARAVQSCRECSCAIDPKPTRLQRPHRK